MFPGGELQYPYTLGQPGHEACGEIVAVGEWVPESLVGQRVCAWRDRGHHLPGCYAQYVAMDTQSVIPVTANLPPEACAPLELAMCMSAHILYAERLDAIHGRRVGVFGLGPAGLVCIQLARAAGAAQIVGFDPMPERRAAADRLGADLTLDPTTHEGSTDFPRRGAPGSLHCSFDCVGAQEAVHLAMAVTTHLVVLFAVQREPYVFAPQFWGGLALVGTQPHTRAAAEYAAGYLELGELDLGSLVTHTMTLGEYSKAVDLLRRKEAVKIAFLPQES
jgi:threonine dehydrogenase-like Zn-dependent dehydrogenase